MEVSRCCASWSRGWPARAREAPWSSTRSRANDACALAEGLWIQWRLESEDAAVRDSEAMEILDLFVRVDYRAAWATLFDMLGYPPAFADRLDEAPLRQYPRFNLRGFTAFRESSAFRRSMGQFLFEIDDAAHSPGYHEAKKLLLSLRPRPMEQEGPVVDLRLSIQLAIRSSRLATRNESLDVLEHVAAFTLLCQDPARAELLPDTALGEWNYRGKRKHCRRFRVESLSAGYMAVPVSDLLLNAGINLAVDLGVRIEDFTLGSASYLLQRLSPRVGTLFFQTMIAKPASTCRGMVLHSHVQIEPFSGACSALLASPSVRSVDICLPEIDADDCDHRLYWPWVAFSLFSAEATNAVEELTLNVFHLTDRHVQAFRRVVEARDPLSAIPYTTGRPEYVVPTPERLNHDPVVVDVRKGTRIWYSVNEEIVVLSTCDQLMTLRLVEDSPDREYVAVLFCGAGVCWIRRDDIIARRLLELPPRRESKLRELKLDLVEGMSLDPVVAMLQIIGPGLRTLEIGAFGLVRLEDDFLRGVLRACPTLVRLDLAQVTVASFRWLPLHNNDAVNTHLDSLSLSGIRCEHPAAYKEFIAAISSAISPLSSRLRLLHIQRDANLLELEWSSAFEMLQGNKRLEQLLLSADYDAADVEIEQDLQDQLETRSGTPLHVQKSPFPLRCRLAFLSVIRRTSPSEGMRKRQRYALPELSVEHLAEIWKYAAPHKKRICGLVPFRPYE